MRYKFDKNLEESGVIFVTAKIDSHTFRMMLDTGATHTTLDIGALYVAGYSIANKFGTVGVETAKGTLQVDIIEVENMTALGRTLHKMPIQVYDFIAQGIISDYDGLLGLDFFKNTEFCINMKNNTIEIKE
jgi:predicted aspartyl protease